MMDTCEDMELNVFENVYFMILILIMRVNILTWV